ncbi:hypothetical protein Poly24_52090 [Rosistilla carotiformis]|uniref:Uncharacterized protein n=2 Tax=Rosistilla carotiformis TaxID=2528017 RepID=A0A518K103_9BACT|nr:hypothetical protein Poly24_52090 [Rosistilla carotiformis]
MLAELAASLAIHGPRLLADGDSIPAAALQDYWIASRNRSTRWHQTLALHREFERSGNLTGLRAWWENQLPTLEEILVSEILTRVYASLGHGLDAKLAEPEVYPVVHSVHVSHLEARNRVLGVMVSQRGASSEAVARLNRLRKTVERWTDVLVGQVAAVFPEAARYGSVLERTLSFAEDGCDQAARTRQTQGWLLMAAIRDSLLRQMSANAANPIENGKISDSVLVCLRPDMFDALGTLQSLWLHRLRHSAQQTDCVLSQLLVPNLDAAEMLPGFEAVRDADFARRMRR